MKKQLFAILLASVLAFGFMTGISPAPDAACAENSAVSTDNRGEIDKALLINFTEEQTKTEFSADTLRTYDTSEKIFSSSPLPDYPSDSVPYSVYINGRRLPDGFGAAVNGTVYIPFDEFFTSIGCTAAEKNAACADGDVYVACGERCIPCSLCDLSVTVKNFGCLCVPASALACAAGMSLTESAEKHVAVIGGVPTFPGSDDIYPEEDLYWLSRIISAESRGEPFEGQLAVGCVVLNRTRCRSYPDTVKEVVFDNKFGIQFTPASTGSVYNAPTSSSVTAAKLCLEGFSLSDSILFFFNSSIAAGSWITSNRTYTMTVGRHDFYS
ncbi:MAG: cell wall hydrolase [Clostridia bacterium]|nr:cell wall hydrolase [Clostridia bacterium]